MNTYLALVVLPNLNVALTLLFIFLLISIVCHLVACSHPDDEGFFNRILSSTKKQAIAGLIMMVALIFIPSEEQLTKVYAVDIIRNTEGIDKLPKNMVAKLNKLLEVDE